MTNNNQDFLLDLYHEAVHCFQDLGVAFEEAPKLPSLSKKQQINICLDKIQNVINIEEASANEQYNKEFMFNLRQLHFQLLQLKFYNQCNNQTNSYGIASKPNKEVIERSKDEQNLRDIIKSTETVPKLKGFEDIAGLYLVKKTLATIVLLPIRQPQLYLNKKISNSILLYGPPGTGKTHLVHALAAEASAALYSVSPSSILSCYIGQTEKLVRTLFGMIRESQAHITILFMDEIDGLCRRRSGDEAEWSRRLKTELLCHLSAMEDCSNIFLICATNCPWDLDPSFYRRFQKRIYIPLPSRPDRFDILKLLTRDTPLEKTSNQWEPLLNKTEGYSGSDLADVVRHAFNVPLSELICNKSWAMVDNNLYRPASLTDKFTSLIQCDVEELPERSVQAREVQFTDLVMAADAVKKTVPDADIMKYEMFENVF